MDDNVERFGYDQLDDQDWADWLKAPAFQMTPLLYHFV